jgi:hypothetical protein
MSEAVRALDWDSEISNDGAGEFVLLEPGDYPFLVLSVTKKHWAGSQKLPACPQAELAIEVGGPEESTTIKHNLFLSSKTEGLLCAFFKSIGQRQHGQKLTMDWSKVAGSNGMCTVGIRKWNGKDGKEHQSNEIKKFLEPVAGAAASDDIPY